MENLDNDLIYMRSYSIESKKEPFNKIQYTTVLGKNTQYVFKICTELNDADGILLTIYNAEKHEVTSNVQGEKILSELEFNCKETGIYYLTFSFHNSQNFCGGCIQSIRR